MAMQELQEHGYQFPSQVKTIAYTQHASQWLSNLLLNPCSHREYQNEIIECQRLCVEYSASMMLA